MKSEQYSNITTTRNGYRDQLIYYYNLGLGRVSEIAGVTITKKLIATIERRYQRLGGILPIRKAEIDAQRGIGWKQL